MVLLAMPHVLRADKVVFYRPYWLTHERADPRRRRRVERLIRWLNPRAVVTEQDPEEAFPLAYENNLASDRAMEEFFPRVLGSASFAVLSAILEDPHVDRFYKMRLLPWLLYETQFYRSVRHRISGGEELLFVPGSHDRHALRRPFFSGEEEFRRGLPRAVGAWLRIKDRLDRGLNTLLGINLLLLLSAPLLFILKSGLRAGIRRRAVPIRADVVMPLIWGFSENGTHRGLKTGLDNSYLLGGGLTPSRVAFYFSDWSFTPEEKRQQQERMSRRGIRHFDPNRFPLTPEFLREALDFYRRLLGGLRRRLCGTLAEERQITWASAVLCYHLMKERFFTARVDYKVLLEIQDYSSAHVVRTILSEKLGRLTVGNHHGAPDGPAGFPVIRYSHIHRHTVWGEAFLKAFGPHWNHMQNELIGS
jgi:hypothetical protein